MKLIRMGVYIAERKSAIIVLQCKNYKVFFFTNEADIDLSCRIIIITDIFDYLNRILAGNMFYK